MRELLIILAIILTFLIIYHFYKGQENFQTSVQQRSVVREFLRNLYRGDDGNLYIRDRVIPSILIGRINPLPTTSALTTTTGPNSTSSPSARAISSTQPPNTTTRGPTFPPVVITRVSRNSQGRFDPKIRYILKNGNSYLYLTAFGHDQGVCANHSQPGTNCADGVADPNYRNITPREEGAPRCHYDGSDCRRSSGFSVKGRYEGSNGASLDGQGSNMSIDFLLNSCSFYIKSNNSNLFWLYQSPYSAPVLNNKMIYINSDSGSAQSHGLWRDPNAVFEIISVTVSGETRYRLKNNNRFLKLDQTGTDTSLDVNAVSVTNADSSTLWEIIPISEIRRGDGSLPLIPSFFNRATFQWFNQNNNNFHAAPIHYWTLGINNSHTFHDIDLSSTRSYPRHFVLGTVARYKPSAFTPSCIPSSNTFQCASGNAGNNQRNRIFDVNDNHRMNLVLGFWENNTDIFAVNKIPRPTNSCTDNFRKPENYSWNTEANEPNCANRGYINSRPTTNAEQNPYWNHGFNMINDSENGHYNDPNQRWRKRDAFLITILKVDGTNCSYISKYIIDDATWETTTINDYNSITRKGNPLRINGRDNEKSKADIAEILYFPCDDSTDSNTVNNYLKAYFDAKYPTRDSDRVSGQTQLGYDPRITIDDSRFPLYSRTDSQLYIPSINPNNPGAVIDFNSGTPYNHTDTFNTHYTLCKSGFRAYQTRNCSDINIGTATADNVASQHPVAGDANQYYINLATCRHTIDEEGYQCEVKNGACVRDQVAALRCNNNICKNKQQDTEPQNTGTCEGIAGDKIRCLKAFDNNGTPCLFNKATNRCITSQNSGVNCLNLSRVQCTDAGGGYCPPNHTCSCAADCIGNHGVSDNLPNDAHCSPNGGGSTIARLSTST